MRKRRRTRLRFRARRAGISRSYDPGDAIEIQRLPAVHCGMGKEISIKLLAADVPTAADGADMKGDERVKLLTLGMLPDAGDVGGEARRMTVAAAARSICRVGRGAIGYTPQVAPTFLCVPLYQLPS